MVRSKHEICIYEGNKEAVNVCERIIRGEYPYRALYLYGPKHSGKTTLLNYLKKSLNRQNPFKKILTPSKGIDFDERMMLTINIDWAYAIVVDDLEDLRKSMTFQEFLIEAYREKVSSRDDFIFIVTAEKPLEEYEGYIDKWFYSLLKSGESIALRGATNTECREIMRSFAKEKGIDTNADLERAISTIINAEGLNLGRILDSFNKIAIRADVTDRAISADIANELLFDSLELELIGA